MPKKAEKRVQVSIAPPHPVRELQPGQLRELLEELRGQLLEGGRALVVGRPQLAPEVVDGVVPAPEDAVVGRHPEVVELVGDIVHALTVAPADRGLLLLGQRLGHQT